MNNKNFPETGRSSFTNATKNLDQRIFVLLCVAQIVRVPGFDFFGRAARS
jgi:hypothetical protein